MLLEGNDLRLRWHSYLCYGKVKTNVDFKNHFNRCTILRIWNRFTANLSPQIHLWLSPQEAFFRRQGIAKQK